MARLMKGGQVTQFRVWVTVRWSSGGEHTSYYGPYMSQGAAQGLLTYELKWIEKNKTSGTVLVGCGIDEAEIAWHPVKTAYERKLEKAQDKFWKEAGLDHL